MTDDEARRRRFAYLAGGVLASVFGLLIIIVTALKGLHFDTYQRQHPGDDAVQAILGWIYENGIIVSWLWPWMSPSGFGGMPNFLLSSSAILGWAFFIVGSLLLTTARRLHRWIRDVTELLAKEQIAASRRPASQRQSIANVIPGRDSYITQEIRTYYNHRPDNPKLAIIVAIIGVIGTIIAALLKSR